MFIFEALDTGSIRWANVYCITLARYIGLVCSGPWRNLAMVGSTVGYSIPICSLHTANLDRLIRGRLSKFRWFPYNSGKTTSAI